jgi:hypothetical protein
MFWYGNNYRASGYWYDYNEFKVVNATERDNYSPFVQDTFVDPYYGTLDVSEGSGKEKVVAMLAVSDTMYGYQSGVDTVHSDIYDSKYGRCSIHMHR